MRRLLLILVALFLFVLAGPPLYFAVFPGPAPAEPSPGVSMEVAPGMQVNVLDQGEGPPVVLVHGLPGTAHHWRTVGEGLVNRGYRVLAYDRVGYGQSDRRPDEAYTVDANARELLSLLEVAQLDDVTVVGWSYGGKTAMTAALIDPSRMARVVLVGSAGFWADAPPPSAVFDVFFSAPVIEWVASVPPLFRGFQEGMGELFFSGQPVPAWFSDVSAVLVADRDTRHTWREESRRFRFDGPDPSAIARPMLLLHGDGDRITPLVIAEGIAESAPGARLVVFPGGSHALPATDPDWVVDQIAGFISEAPAD
jgi:pimeloyl-ACP methyl ester carboxylesterase